MEVLALLLTDALAEQDGLEVLVQQVNIDSYLHNHWLATTCLASYPGLIFISHLGLSWE